MYVDIWDNILNINNIYIIYIGLVKYPFPWYSHHIPIMVLSEGPFRRMSILSAPPVVLPPERCAKQLVDYPMVNIQKAIENHHFE